MQSISNPIKGEAQKKYYLDMAREDYYASRFEKPGRWFGEGAKILGLTDEVEGVTFHHLLAGLSVDGKRRLVQNAQHADRQCGWDITFSAPKGVSVLWALAPQQIREQVEEAHRCAVEAALTYLEQTAGITRRGKGGAIKQRAALIFATFQHGTSRALDPELHTHCLLINVCLRSDGTTGTLQSIDLFRAKMKGGAIYRDTLASQLRQRLVLTILPEKVGFHIQGVPKELCLEMSKRGCMIKKVMKERGLQGALAAKAVARETRPAKQHIAPEELFARWQQAGQAHGWGATQAEQLCQNRRRIAQQKSQSGQIGASFEQEQSWRAGAQKLVTPDTARFDTSSDGFNTSQSDSKAQTSARESRLKRKRFVRIDWDLMFPKAAKWRLTSGWKSPRIVVGERTIPQRWEKVLWSKDFIVGEVRVQQKCFFPKARAWNPLKNWKTPAFVFGNPQRPEYWDRILWKKKLILGELRIQRRLLFPRAPKRSPLSKIRLPALRIGPKSSTPFASQQSKEQSQQRSH